MSGAIVFDLDGTLIDSAPDLREAVNRMLAEHEQPPLDLDTVKSFVGNGLAKTVERAMIRSGMDLADHAACLKATYAHYDTVNGALSRPYPDVPEVLEALTADGHPLGICTNKSEGAARSVVAKLGLDDYFGVLIGGDTLPVMKPDPTPLFQCFQTLGGRPLLYVGDSETDAATAQAAQIPFALYSGGYRKSPVQDIPHDYLFDAYAALPGLVARHMAAFTTD